MLSKREYYVKGASSIGEAGLTISQLLEYRPTPGIPVPWMPSSKTLINAVSSGARDNFASVSEGPARLRRLVRHVSRTERQTAFSGQEIGAAGGTFGFGFVPRGQRHHGRHNHRRSWP
jgi:hypothetical protein